MKAIWFPALGEVTVGDMADPIPGPGEVLIAVRASGICHTDLEVMHANYGTAKFPIVPGHEYAGEIVDIGPGVEGFAAGDRVVVDPNLECGTCRACGRGWAHLCERLGAYGVTAKGGFAERSVVKAARVHPIGDMRFDLAALAEPVGCVLNGLSPLAGRLIERAVIFGTGPMGLLMALVLQVRGICEVTMVDTNPERLDRARSFGLAGLEAGSPALDELRRSCDLAVEATGVAAVAEALTGYVANGGSALYFGVCPKETRIAVSPFEIFRRQLSLFGTHSLNHNIPEALETIRSIGPKIEKVITHRLRPDEIARIFAGDRLADSMKVQMVL
jgi:2-desacetyl-2-hydroxyethyl bacteriochlorophyllide A dehydrogenase